MPRTKYNSEDGGQLMAVEILYRLINTKSEFTVLDLYALALKSRVHPYQIRAQMNNTIKSALASNLIRKSGRYIDKGGVPYPVYFSVRGKRSRKKMSSNKANIG